MTSPRTDADRCDAGMPCSIEQGPTPGAVAELRLRLRLQAGRLIELRPLVAQAVSKCNALQAEQDIVRGYCDELMDAIARLEQADA